MTFSALHVDEAPDVVAPDGSTVRVLVRTASGSMARFSLPPFAVSRAVAHRTVEEVWYFLAGSGRMWLRSGDRDAIIDVAPGMSVAIPAGTAFQFRSDSAEPLQAIGVTMPPWPGDGEAVAVEGPWPATI
ncbi:MAG TPA: cupin domain-containing protein [Acetobacteraceae bacterium]|jgi:mannose-6-phosphate isomerase-like protein (cupin superfamily)|nr:cupin domain-containing protein [Acetobacteraceae bacterium]